MEPDIAGFRNSNLAIAGFGENVFLDHGTIRLMTTNGVNTTMLSAAIKTQYTSVLLCYVAVCQLSTKFVEQQILYFFVQLTQIEIGNAPPYRSPALVLSVIN